MTFWFVGLALRCLRPHRVLMHFFFFYLPLSFALSIGHDWTTSLVRGLISLIYIGLWAIASATTNDFFDRLEDSGYKDNPFYEYEVTEKNGLAFILTLQIIAFLFSIGVALAFDIRVVLFTILAGVASWWYSDNTYIRRVFGFRLKSHYAVEWFAIVFGYGMLFTSTLAINQVLILEATPILILVLLAFLMATIRKDIPQVAKDSQACNLTFPVLYGEEKANRLIRILTYVNFLALALFSTLGFLPFLTILGLTWFVGEAIALRWHWSYELTKGIVLLLYLNPYFLLISLGLLLT